MKFKRNKTAPIVSILLNFCIMNNEILRGFPDVPT